MGTLRYSKEEQEQLRQLYCVEKVTEKMLVFKQSFKRKAVAKSRQGYTANQIFKDAGIDISKYAPKYFHHLLKRWKHDDLSDGIAQGRPRKEAEKSLEEMSIDELKARVAYLELENDFLKKLKALEQGANIEDLP